MKRFSWLITIAFPLLTTAQGIQFQNDLSWEQVKQKAKTDNKYIFVDASASWCIPCKRMEKEVFPLQNVGNFMNEKFVSVHVQIDTSKSDNETTRAWYKDARDLRQQYAVTAFPTYLFFSPDGKIVHRCQAAMSDSLFLKVAANSLDPAKQYYTLLGAYQKGKRDYNKLSYLANISKIIGNDTMANKIAADYFRYLDKQSGKELLQKQYLEFAYNFPRALRPDNKLFKTIYNNEKRVDEIMERDHFTTSLITTVIKKELTVPVIKQATDKNCTPDWNSLQKAILKKFNAYYGNLALLQEQIHWYFAKKDNLNEMKYQVKLLDDYGVGISNWIVINNVCFDLIFKYSNNPDTLNKAIRWMEAVNTDHPDDQNDLDTYANLLYKAGRREDAIAWEEKAKKLEEAAAEKGKRKVDASFAETLDKMKKGIPTWE